MSHYVWHSNSMTKIAIQGKTVWLLWIFDKAICSVYSNQKVEIPAFSVMHKKREKKKKSATRFQSQKNQGCSGGV